MIKKTIVVIAASALACGLFASAASAKTTKPKAKQTTAAKAEPMKSVPGNNPFPIASNSAPVQNAKPYEPIKGNNPLVNQTAAPKVSGAKPSEGIKGNNPMGVASK
jgi:hypothetical protein